MYLAKEPVNGMLGDEIVQWLGFLSWFDPNRPLIMLQVAIDESGTHQNAPVFCVAACVATTRQWQSFANEWVPRLESTPKPEGATYHANNAGRWCADLHPFLAELIVRRMDLVLVFTMSEAEFKASAPAGFRSRHGGAYGLLCFACLSRLADRCRQGHKSKMAYVFESGHRGQGYVNTLWTRLEAIPQAAEHFCLHSHAWVGKRDPVVHPPDLVSHEYASCFGKPVSAIVETLNKRVVYEHFTPEYIADQVNRVAWLETREGRPIRRQIAPEVVLRDGRCSKRAGTPARPSTFVPVCGDGKAAGA